jgi:hypothetical protein
MLLLLWRQPSSPCPVCCGSRHCWPRYRDCVQAAATHRRPLQQLRHRQAPLSSSCCQTLQARQQHGMVQNMGMSWCGGASSSCESDGRAQTPLPSHINTSCHTLLPGAMPCNLLRSRRAVCTKQMVQLTRCMPPQLVYLQFIPLLHQHSNKPPPTHAAVVSSPQPLLLVTHQIFTHCQHEPTVPC